MKRVNTLQKGGVRYIVFRETGEWYAVALEFNIVETGSTPREALILLFEAIQGYVEAARKIKIRTHVLNQRSEYEDMWKELEDRRDRRQSNLPSVYTFGQMPMGGRFLSA